MTALTIILILGVLTAFCALGLRRAALNDDEDKAMIWLIAGLFCLFGILLAASIGIARLIP